MTTAPVPRRSTTGDFVATALLAVLGLTVGFAIGGLFLVFTPTQSWWPLWSLACIGIMAAPVVTAIIGILRMVRGRVGFWVPLVGLGVVAVLLAVIVALSASIQPVLLTP